jgi:hypothetical protein
MDESPHRTPRWVKVFAAIAVVVVLLIAAMLISGHRGAERHFGTVDASALPERLIR